MYRLIFCVLTACFILFGFGGLYMFVMAIASPFQSYPLQDAVERAGVLYSIILMAMGLMSYLFFLSFVRHFRGTVDRKNPLWIDRLTGAMIENW